MKNGPKHCPDMTCCEGKPKAKKKSSTHCSCKRVDPIDVNEKGYDSDKQDTVFMHWSCGLLLTDERVKKLGLR